MIEKIKEEITNDPLGIGYSQMTNAQIAESLNSLNRTKIVERFVNERTLFAELGAIEAETLIEKLEAVAPSNSIIKRAVNWLNPNQEGIDVGHPNTRSMISSLVGIITQEEADKVLALAEMKISRAIEIGIDTPIYEGHIERAKL